MLNTFSSENRSCLITFDLDGTLINTISDLGASVSYALNALGLPEHTLEEYTRFVGNGTLMLIKRSLPDDLKENEEIVSKAHELFSGYYADHFADRSQVYNGMTDALSELKSKGFKLAVLTNKPDAFSKKMISLFFPAGMFDVVFGARDGVPKKPDPTAENEIIRLLNADKNRTVHIGDSDVDVLTAKNACVKCIGCSWGFRSKESLVDAGADEIAYSPDELPGLVYKLLEAE